MFKCSTLLFKCFRNWCSSKSEYAGIYKISSSDEKKLDKKEGFIEKYCENNSYNKEWIPIIYNGESIYGLVYVMNNPIAVPAQNNEIFDIYYRKIQNGYIDFNLDDKYLVEAYDEYLEIVNKYYVPNFQ